MDRKGEPGSGTLNFFVTLPGRGRKGLFERHPVVKATVETLWPQVMRAHPQLDAANYNVNGSRLHALVQVQAGPEAAEAGRALLDAALAAFQEISESAWQDYRQSEGVRSPAQLWDPAVEVRPVRDADEFLSLREFMVQKMLGGELSDLDDEEWY